MKRRSFLKNAAAGVAAGTLAAPAIAQSQPTINWRMAASWPKSLDTLYGGAELISKRVGQDDRRQVQHQGVRGRRDRRRPAGDGCGAERHRGVRPYRRVLLLRQGPDLRVRHEHPVRPQFAAAIRLVHPRRRPRAHARVLQGIQHRQLHRRLHGLPDGRLVPQAGQVRGRSEGLEVPHRRDGRHGARQARRGAAADRGR